jgi:hypothetical protein
MAGGALQGVFLVYLWAISVDVMLVTIKCASPKENINQQEAI